MYADVAIIGAGTTGAAAAWQCARRGMRVVCLDRRPLETCGARWVNGIALWQLDAAEIPRPDAEELHGRAGRYHLLAGWGPHRLVIEGNVLVDLDMRRLVARLQGMAMEAGATLLPETRASGFDGCTLSTTAGPIRAGVFVDASGLGGAGLMRAPSVDPAHVCVASQGVFEVTDRAAARGFFQQHGADEGDAMTFAGIAGGYSILNLQLAGDEVSALSGSVPATGHPSGRAILQRFVGEQPWIGQKRFGGSRAIPLRRPFDRLSKGNVALLGDAASQVCSVHGSGVGPGLVAGHLLARSLATGHGVRGYAVRYQRRYGGLMAAFDRFRRFSQTLTVQELGVMMREGLMDATLSSAAMAQRWPVPDPGTAGEKVAALTRNPRLGVKLVQAMSGMGTLAALYRAYPTSEGSRLAAWSRAVARVFRERPDVG